MVAAHNLDVIKSADWITDLELEGGEAGGHIVAEGRLEQVAKVAASYTGRFLAPLLAHEQVHIGPIAPVAFQPSALSQLDVRLATHPTAIVALPQPDRVVSLPVLKIRQTRPRRYRQPLYRLP